MCFSTQCYKAPFFDLTVKVVDQELSPVQGVSVRVVAADIDSDNLDLIDGANLTDLEGNELVCNTNGSGECQFSFEKKAFVTILACMSSNNNNNAMCQESYVYLKEDENTLSTIMLVDYAVNDYNCNYCN
tara:strand:- start:102 stop:491 length:390 start_codon:yes stop_codon:yes gene_type:complete